MYFEQVTIRRRFNQSVLHHFMEKYTIYRLFTSDIRDVRYRNVVGRLRCPRILPGWRLDLSLRGECRYFINYIHRTSDVGRACVSSRRDVSRHARHDGNRMPPSSLLLVRFRPLSFFLRLKYLVRWMTTLDIQVDMPVLER